MWIDTHTHLDKIKTDTQNILEQAKKSSVEKMITIGTCLEDWGDVVSISRKYFPQVCGALGVHPNDAETFNQESEDFLRKYLSEDFIVALGEIGLDYYRERAEKKVQREVFIRQIELAKEFFLPLEIHSRNAEEDTIEILNLFKGSVRGLLHCFTGSYQMAKEALDLGFNISFSGIVTFSNAKDLKETCKKIPLDRIHIETDAPFLAPTPKRGKENSPAWLPYIAKEVCQIHEIDLDTLSEQLKKNTKELFPKITWS